MFNLSAICGCHLAIFRDLFRRRSVLASRLYLCIRALRMRTPDSSEKPSSIFTINETHGEALPKTGGPIKLNEILHEVAKHIEDRFKTGNVITGISTGFIDLDYMTSGLQPGELIIVAGRPGMGTTSFATSLLESTLLQTDKAILVFSLDISAASLGMRMLSSIGRIEIAKMREGRLEADDWPKLTSAINLLNDRKLFIVSVRPTHLA